MSDTLYNKVVIKPHEGNVQNGLATQTKSSNKPVAVRQKNIGVKKPAPTQKRDFQVTAPKPAPNGAKTVAFSVTEKADDPDKKELDTFDKLIENSQAILFHAKSVFPFDFFPDEITVDKKKVTIKYSQFFWSSYIQTVMIDDLYSVELGTTPFFSTLIIRYRMGSEEARIGTLWPKEAQKGKSILQGLLVTKKERINMTRVNETKLSKKLEDVGSTGALA